MNSKSRTYFNLILSFLVFLVNYGVNFFVTPYVSKHLPGTYGYVKMATDVIGYAQLLTIAIDSMAGRFISIEYNKGNKAKARQYYCSVMAANIVMAILFLIPMLLFAVHVDSIIEVPSQYIFDVKILFALSFIGFLLTLSFSANSIVTFVLNRLDLSFYVEAVVYIIRAGLLLALFTLAPPNVFYIGFVSVITALITILGNQLIKQKILSEFRLDLQFIKFKLVKEIFFAGIWNSVQKLGHILLDGLDLLIANVMVCASAMNDLSFAKTMPAIVASLLVKVSSVFMPNYTILYAQEKFDELKKNIKTSMIILSIIISIPIGIIMSFGYDFYSLWIPQENIKIVAILSTLSCIVYVVSAPMNAVYNLFTVTNKVKSLAMVMLASGFLSTVLVFLLLGTTSLGVYAVVCCSVAIGIMRNILFVAPYAAKMLGFSIFTFFPEIIKSIFSVLNVMLLSFVVKKAINVDCWTNFFLASICVALIAVVINFAFLLNQELRHKIIGKIWRHNGRH